MKQLLCGCTDYRPCEEHELDDEDRCELREGEDRCPNRATQQVEEPYTPGRFTMRVCDSCAKSQIEFGYLPVIDPFTQAADEACTQLADQFEAIDRKHGVSHDYSVLRGRVA